MIPSLKSFWNLLESIFVYRWEHELFLYLLPLPLVLLLFRYLIRRNTKSKVVLSFIKPIKQNKLTRLLSFIPDTVLSLCLVCLIFALADPYQVVYHQRIQQEGVEIVIAIDLSSSMLNKDVYPSRLEVAKHNAKSFIKARKYDNIAVVAFAGAPYLASPLTQDTAFLQHSIDRLQNDQIPEEGTALGDALGMSINQVREEANPKRINILISDGNNTAGNLDPLTSAALAKTFGIKVYTIAVGSQKPSLDPVDETTLRQIASKSNGRFFRATDQSTLQAIFNEIDKLEKSRKLIIRDEEHVSSAFSFFVAAFAFYLLSLILKLTWIENMLED
jgi:Ca-activated chloride channel family protein